jgi:uncharacterized delta-60 repeat protein
MKAPPSTSIALAFALAVSMLSMPAVAEDGPGRYRRGDANADDQHDITDAVRVFRFLFLGDEGIDCLKSADVNDDGQVNISDGIALLGFLFLGEAAPPPPFEVCGFDGTPDGVPCPVSQPGCSGDPPPGTVGSAGGTVICPGGAMVVIPPGALAADTAITIEESLEGAPALPDGFSSFGPMFAFTPHGLEFAVPVALTVPFDPTAVPAGVAPLFYKTNAENQWEALADATINEDTVTAQVTSFSWAKAGAPPPPLVLTQVQRSWQFFKLSRSTGIYESEPAEPEQDQMGGVVNDNHNFGPMFLYPPGEGPDALAEVFANETGQTYWVSAQVPQHDSDLVGAGARLDQYQRFRKTRDNASLKIIISKVILELIDIDGAEMTNEDECPVWNTLIDEVDNWIRCTFVLMAAKVFFDLDVSLIIPELGPDQPLLKTRAVAILDGWRNFWGLDVHTFNLSTTPFWDRASFDFECVDGDDFCSHARASLRSPITIDVPLSAVSIGDVIQVKSYVFVVAHNRRVGELQYGASYFRDPSRIDGLAFSFEGLEPIETPSEIPPPPDPEPAPPCLSGPDPAAGIVQFEADAFLAPELPEEGAIVVVTRSGGSQGAVSAMLTTSDDTALGGTDYTPVSTHVLFADGEEGSRAVQIPIVSDATAEPDKTLRLTLSDPRGCAALGPQATAVLTIVDDDAAAAPTYTVGGTVSGLEGSGLELEERHTGSRVTPGNGGFTFDYPFLDGSIYEVRVVNQPSDPLQVCSVANAGGVLAGADADGVAVTCTTPGAGGELDAGFGSDGKVYSQAFSPGTAAVAIQSAGEIVVVRGKTLARFDGRGGADAGFGAAGTAPVPFSGSSGEAFDVTVQPDDKILVAGTTLVGTRYLMAIARFDSEGLPDGGFGSGGMTTLDPYAIVDVDTDDGLASGDTHRAYKALAAPDGKIYAAGLATLVDPRKRTHFAVVRLNADGSPDAGFGGDGSATAVLTNAPDIAYSLGLQSDGKLLLAGAANNSIQTGLARFHGDGRLDVSVLDLEAPDFGYFGYGPGGMGVALVDAGVGGQLARDLVMLDDNSCVVAAQKSTLNAALGFHTDRMSLLHVSPGGRVLSSVTATVSEDYDYPRALVRQADGKLLLIGSAGIGAAADFAILRFNPDLALDDGFGDGGVLKLDFFASIDSAEDAAIQPDGGIVVVGAARNGLITGLGMVRLLP